MSKKPSESSNKIFAQLNRILPWVAVVVIGYILWAAIYKPGNGHDAGTTVASADPIPASGINEESASAADRQQPSPPATLGDAAETEEDVEPPKSDPSGSNSAPTSEENVPSSNETQPDSTPVADPEEPQPTLVLGDAPKFYDTNVAKFLFEKKCSECHKLARVEKHAFADLASVEPLIEKMIENGLEVNDKEQAFLVHYLKSTFVK